ncbi:hypothetical protein [Adhaeretor mobilis]|uniref:Uncharacterized protein n=1 Tax=Adhaeretor mobilis TaxID=1930276 RepID=A0A517N2K0_9BACT|nr:hypothetical protein [Adhaeretor mobilis]QDT01362.1 hypothetical protein HG15A2_47040 [Adhaeretor mobilis]
MDFKRRLQKAAERGEQAREERAKEAAAKALSEEEYRRLHSSYRLELADHIESCVKQLAENFPGFKYEAVVSEKGWGAAVHRDDLSLKRGKRDNLFSRLELTISPFNKYHVLDLVAKGAVRNKENFTRNHFQKLNDADLDSFRELVELWTLDYAEEFAGS